MVGKSPGEISSELLGCCNSEGEIVDGDLVVPCEVDDALTVARYIAFVTGISVQTSVIDGDTVLANYKAAM